jgi:hypothetical protein
MLQFIRQKLVELIGMKWNLRDWDDSSDPIYVGYVNKYGAWKIEEVNETDGTVRVAAGSKGYFGAWTNRVQLVYSG